MDYRFKHSLVVMGQLAQHTARTPPSEDDPPLEYVDRSLTILGRTFDARNQRMQQEFLGQREFIASQFRVVEKKMDERFQKVDRRFEEFEKKMDERFQKVDRRFEEFEKKMDERFQKVDRRFEEFEKKMDERFKKVDRRFEEFEKKMDERFDKQEGEIRDVKVQLENAAAITRNSRLRRMHQSINLIKVLKPAVDPNNFVWTSHPQVPKHIKDTYILGQRAKGVFEPSWEGKPDQQKAQAKQKAICTISELASFYNVVISSDDQSESDATQAVVQEWCVDDYMEALLAEWGMDWQKVLGLGMQHMQAQPQQAGVKRAGDVNSRGEKKKTRGEREE